MLLQVFYLILSIAILYYGAEFALDAAEKIGLYFGLSPLVIGLVIVGFGTSLPEFFVSQLASYRGVHALGLGNIIGSNVANLFLILGVGGVMTSLNLGRKEIQSQLWLHLCITLVLGAVVYIGKINIYSLLVFSCFFALYIFNTFHQMRKQGEHLAKADSKEIEKLSQFIFFKLIVGLAALFGGGELLVSSGSELGRLAGISEYVISAVFVAFGTSFPELVTTVLACLKGKDTDLITGNILGSNAFNLTFVLGSLGIYDFELESTFLNEMTMLIGASVYLLIFSYLNKKFFRLSGSLFLATYAVALFLWFKI